MVNKLSAHIVQSPQWGEFKSKMGTKAVRVGDVQFTLHPIPYTKFNLGYCPKVAPEDINWEKISFSGIKNDCIAVRFDVPNMIKRDNEEYKGIEKGFQKHCVRSPKDTFAKWNVFTNITKSEEELLKSFHHKTRYNIKLAKKKGVFVKEESNEKGIKIFNELNKVTSKRQKFYIHQDSYYSQAFKVLNKNGMANILVAYYKAEPLVAYILLNYKNVLYYPYGASSSKLKNLMPANLIMWKSIKLGKKLGCKIFDMWGAAKNESDKEWWGFTRFKLGYGGEHVEYMDSYDLVLNKPIYHLFNIADWARWKILNLKKLI